LGGIEQHGDGFPFEQKASSVRGLRTSPDPWRLAEVIG
jgi:hypothetical protein